MRTTEDTMSDRSNKQMKDIRFRNVSLHSRGKTERGTLILTTHHLIFTFAAESNDSSRRAATGGRAGTPEVSAKLPSHEIIASPASANTQNNAHIEKPLREQPDSTAIQSSPVDHHDTPKKSSSAGPRPKLKEIWVPYPMINLCTLRPSNFQGLPSVGNEHHHDEEHHNNVTEMSFPPIYGTNFSSRSSAETSLHAVQPNHLRTSSPQVVSPPDIWTRDTGRAPALRIRRRDFQMMAFHFHAQGDSSSADNLARDAFYHLRDRCCVEKIESMHAFHFKPPVEEISVNFPPYDARREFGRMGIGEKAGEGVGSGWRLTDINRDYSYAPTYPSVICVPRAVSDNTLKYGGSFRSKARIPALSYLHRNGGSITRSSQPLVGLQNKRNPQDERLVSAIFASHISSQESSGIQSPHIASLSPQTTMSSDTSASKADAVEHDAQDSSASSDNVSTPDYDQFQPTTRKKIYGSTRRNLIVDARPKINALANRATGGGIEDITNYVGTSGIPIEKVYLNIANIHVMRQSLEKVIESMANSDYLDMKPNQELLRKSGWLSHISNMMEGAEMVARVVGLTGSHALVHCSDGWDRTAQISGLAEIMLDPYYRTLSGFIVLVQKDFLAFGHKFNHRNGIQGSEKWFEIENERVLPTRTKDTNSSEPTSLNALGSKAFSGAKSWFEKNRSTLFRQQNDPRSSQDESDSRPPSPPMNSILHSSASPATKEDKEHKTDVKEIAPIFHQFLDAVYQIQHQYPNAFEFNERFLRRLLYQTHSSQYGEFLFNNESQRSAHVERTHSVWPHFLSRRREFTNPEYSAKDYDTLIFPRRRSPGGEIDVRWWSTLFGRKDEDMNSPRSLAPPDPDIAPPRLSSEPGQVVSVSTLPQHPEARSNSNLENIHGQKSKPQRVGDPAHVPEGASTSNPANFQTSPRGFLTNEFALNEQPKMQGGDQEGQKSLQQSAVEVSDPLRVVVAPQSVQSPTSRLDAAAFARGSAFSDRTL